MAAALLLEGIARGGSVLFLGPPRPELDPALRHHELEAPPSLAALRRALAEPRAPELFDAAVVCGWAREVPLPGLVDEVCRVVREEGRVAFAAPVARAGWRGARGTLIGVLRRRRPLPLEQLCGALLLGGCVDVRVREVEGAAGVCLVWGRVPAGTREDVESSAIRSTGGAVS